MNVRCGSTGDQRNSRSSKPTGLGHRTDEGEMECGEFGPGRLPEPAAIIDWLARVPETVTSRKAYHRHAGPRMSRSIRCG